MREYTAWEDRDDTSENYRKGLQRVRRPDLSIDPTCRGTSD